MTIATIKKEIKDLKNALNTNLDEKFKIKLREQLSKSEKTLAEMESAKTPTAKKTATKKANVVAKKSTSVLQKVKQANKKAEPKKSTPAKKSTAKQPSALQKIKNQVKLNKNLSGYKKSGIDLLRDGNRPALPAGKRISKDGNVYYENRLNRVDVRQPSKKVAKPNKLEDGGMMAKGGIYLISDDGYEVNISQIDFIKETRLFFKKSMTQEQIKKLGTSKYNEFIHYLIKRGYEKMADGGMMANGGRLKSALMRDRAYKSNEPYEQAYKRKTRPKNPKYNYGFFEDGGSTEMHRAYAMGGVLQHGLESGDFIVSHDEGKMVVMNGGNKYEVNIHSGSRTKID
jgi:glucan-binding YG repeat protein